MGDNKIHTHTLSRRYIGNMLLLGGLRGRRYGCRGHRRSHVMLLRSCTIETTHEHVTHVRLRRMLSILMRSRTRRSLLSTKMISTPSSTETRLLRLLRLRRRCETTHSVWVRILLHRTTSEHSERMSWWWHVIAISTRSSTA